MSSDRAIVGDYWILCSFYQASYQVETFIQLFATFVGGFIAAFIKEWLFSLVMLTCIPPLAICGAFLTIFVSRMASRGQAAYSQAGTTVEQTLGSIRTVVMFTGKKHGIPQYGMFLNKAYKSGVQQGLAYGLGVGPGLLMIFLTYALGIWFDGNCDQLVQQVLV